MRTMSFWHYLFSSFVRPSNIQFLIFHLWLNISGFILENKTQSIFRITNLLWKKMHYKIPRINTGLTVWKVSPFCRLAELYGPYFSVLKSTRRINFFLIGWASFPKLSSILFLWSSLLPPICCLCSSSRSSQVHSFTLLWCERIQTVTD